MRKWTAIGMCLVVAVSGVIAYALTRGSDTAAAPAKPKAALTFPAHIAALPPEVRPRLVRAAEDRPQPEHAEKADRASQREHPARRPATKRAAQPAEHDPGLGGPSGGTPAPGGGDARPVVTPTPVPTVVPSTTAPAATVSLPAGTTVGTVVDLITAKTGEAPATTLPPSTPVVPETTTVDCAASAPPSDGSGSSKDELVRQVVDALCSDAADHSGPGSGKPGDDRSGPAGVSGSSRTR